MEKIIETVMDNVSININSFNGVDADVFISENDVFTVKINYYKKNGDIIIEKLDSDFDYNNDVKSFEVTFKYPSYLDAQEIISNTNEDGVNFSNLISLQNVRIVTLMKSWTLNSPIKNINTINNKFMKALRILVEEKIGMEGII